MRFILALFTLSVIGCSQNKKSITADAADSTRNPRVTEKKVSLAQKNSFEIRINDGSNWDVKIDTISKAAFQQNKAQIQPKAPKMNGDSLLKIKSKEFESVISLSDSCCILKGVDKDVRLCKYKHGDFKGFADYKLFDFKQGMLIFYQEFYEAWNYITYDPVTRKSAYTTGPPIFIKDRLIYACGEYYGTPEIQLNDFDGNRHFEFVVSGWSLKGFYHLGSTIYFEFTTSWPVKGAKYLRLTF